MRAWLRDIRFGVRSLLRSPGITSLTVITLALGIGATTAIFSVADAVLFRLLPFAEPERIVMVWENNPRLKLGTDKLPASAADFLDWREQNKVFEDVAAFTTFSFSLTGEGVPAKIDSVLCSSGFFSVLGVPAARGRTFNREEDRKGNDRVAVISDGLWRRQFGADPNILNRTITLTGEKYAVIGVMPPGFTFPQGSALPNLGFTEQTDLWVPLAFDEATAKDRRTLGYPVVARLKPGVSIQQAQSDMSAIAANIDQQFKKSAGFGVTLTELREQIVGDVRLALWVLLGTVAIVLLIACANVANLLLSHFSWRQKEFALRTALGATRFHLVRQLLTESVLLALVGGALGLLLAKLGTDLLLAVSPDTIPRSQEVGVSPWVLGFAFAVSLLAGVISGLAPSLRASRSDPNSVLKEEARGATPGGAGRRLRNLLIVSQVGMTLVLVIGAGLLIKSFWLLQQVRLGFNPDNVLTAQMALPSYKYQTSAQKNEFFRQLLQRLSALPGAESATVATSLPLTGTDTNSSFDIEGRPPAAPQDKPLADVSLVSPDFFRTLGAPLQKGRAFNEHDTETSAPVAVINEALARSQWPGEDPIGKRLSVTLEGGKIQREIVGVVGSVLSASLSAEPKPAIYMPYAQNPFELVFVAVRTKGDPLALAPSLRKEVLAVDQDQPVYDVRSMRQVIATAGARNSFSMVLFSMFAALALALAVAGVYGVVASSVSQRTHEVGIRMALGARPRDILGLFLKQGMLPILLGVAAGVAAAFGLTRVMGSLLYQISATDPAIFAAAILLLAAAAVLAIYFPARRATKLAPMVALRD